MSDLLYKPKNAYDILSEEEIKKAYDYCEGYKSFLDNGKIERLCIENSVKIAEKAGFVPFIEGTKYKSGDKIYYVQKKRAAIFTVIGSETPESGFNITAAHVDCPRIDLKPNPLYEDNGLAMFKTHYYGGLRKYQWVAMPLILCGVVCKKDGTVINVNIGSDESDPLFCITDLLPHLGKDQAQKPLGTAFTGENLNVLFGSRPDKSTEKDKVKTTVMKLLNEKYGMNEEDFLTAELSIVPEHKARDIGMDRSMIASFGQDDRVCAYPGLTALMEAKNLKKTSVTVFADREEVGSMGLTGMRSAYLKNFLEALCGNSYNIRKAFANSAAISADVSAAFDPNFPEVYEVKNSAFINQGIAISKYTGSGGKSGASEAGPEFMARLCNIFDNAGALYQMSELGKVDQGGGGTVSQYIADLNIEVVDIGVAILCMHAPYEVAGKTDIYMLHKACMAFYENY